MVPDIWAGIGLLLRPACAAADTMSWRPTFRARTTQPGFRIMPTPSSRPSAIAQIWSWWRSRLARSRCRSCVPRKKAALLVLVAGLVPAPGEAAADWWADTGYDDEVHEHYANDIELFYQDVPAELAAEALRRGRRQSETATRDPWPLEAWPDVPTRFILCRNDRLLPAAFLRRVVKDRLGITPDEIDAGHCVALSRPQELADRLEKYCALAVAGGRMEP